MRLKYYLQKWIGNLLDSPIIPEGKTTGYSLVKSERFDTTLGKNTRVAAPFFLHHVQLGDYSYISKNSSINNCEIGKFCSIGPNFCCGLGIHPTNGISTAPMFYSTAKQNGTSLCKENKINEYAQTIIGNDVFIGANVTVLDGVTIGDGAVIGAGAVVSKSIPPYAIAGGVPAKIINYRFNEETVAIFLRKKWWEGNDASLQRIEELFFEIDTFINQ